MNGLERVFFDAPQLLYLLLLLPVAWLGLRFRSAGSVLFSRADAVGEVGASGHAGSRLLPILPGVLRSGAIALLILALAHPYWIRVEEATVVRGKGTALALDLSSSMLALDMEEGRTRLEVARQAALEFAAGRSHDELSLVAFAGRALTRVPPTTDAGLVTAGIESLEVQLLRDGSDISSGILSSVARLLESEREPRVIILLSDGAHNGVGVPPLVAARVAAAAGVKVHGISISGPDDGRPGRFGRGGARAGGAVGDGDREPALSAVAAITGGEYFRATSAAGLDSIYAEIDRIEEPVEEVLEREERRSLRSATLLLGLLLVGVEGLLRGSRWGVLP